MFPAELLCCTIIMGAFLEYPDARALSRGVEEDIGREWGIGGRGRPPVVDADNGLTGKSARSTPRNAMKEGRLEAVKLFKKRNDGPDPSPLMETDFMSEELSQLDTDDDVKKSMHRTELEKAAQSNTADAKDGVAIWEVIRPASDHKRFI
ncbi:hypothetical protein BDR04DRAFT_1163252 [Suillus decipiens]|nr:hypothetical protein BDR04DRAFT_1163252 [Suillus decipiens]